MKTDTLIFSVINQFKFRRILVTLYLFQHAERKWWQNENDQVLIDVTVSLSD